jgi:uncharacterized protein with gpF-like domain
VKEHTSLIKSVKQQHLDKVNQAIKRGIREGRLQKDIAKEIRERTAIEKRRAQLDSPQCTAPIQR